MKSIFDQIKRFDNQTEFIPGQSFNIKLPSKEEPKQLELSEFIPNIEDKMTVGKNYTIFVKKYMTEHSTPTFDFMEKWNNDIPMPLMEMTGKVIKETRGMMYMSLHGQIKASFRCMCCGRKLTNPISKLYGMGPECGGHFYIDPFSTKEEYEAAIEDVQNKIMNISWEGWVIKSAIKEWEEI